MWNKQRVKQGENECEKYRWKKREQNIDEDSQ